MKYIIILLLIIVSTNCYGQNYFPFANTNNKQDTAHTTLSLKADSMIEAYSIRNMGGGFLYNHKDSAAIESIAALGLSTSFWTTATNQTGLSGNKNTSGYIEADGGLFTTGSLGVGAFISNNRGSAPGGLNYQRIGDISNPNYYAWSLADGPTAGQKIIQFYSYDSTGNNPMELFTATNNGIMDFGHSPTVAGIKVLLQSDTTNRSVTITQLTDSSVIWRALISSGGGGGSGITSITANNGITQSVSLPNATLGLGNITPTSVVATGNSSFHNLLINGAFQDTTGVIQVSHPDTAFLKYMTGSRTIWSGLNSSGDYVVNASNSTTISKVMEIIGTATLPFSLDGNNTFKVPTQYLLMGGSDSAATKAYARSLITGGGGGGSTGYPNWTTTNNFTIGDTTGIAHVYYTSTAGGTFNFITSTGSNANATFSALASTTAGFGTLTQTSGTNTEFQSGSTINFDNGSTIVLTPTTFHSTFNDFLVPVSSLVNGNLEYIDPTNIGVNAADLQGQTSGIILFTYTPPSDITYSLRAYLNCTLNSSTTINLVITYTDGNNNPQTKLVWVADIAGVLQDHIGTTGDFSFLPFDFRAKAGTLITISTTFASGSSATYDVGANLTQAY